MADVDFIQLQQLLDELAAVRAILVQMPGIGSTADADKFVRVNPAGTNYVLDALDLTNIGAAARTLTIGTGVSSETGLNGGGALTADRNLSLAFNALPTPAAFDLTDRLAGYDVSASVHVRYTLQQILNMVGSLTALTTLESADGLLAWDSSANAAKLLSSTQLLGAASNITLDAYTSSKTGALGYSVPSTLISALCLVTGGGGGGGRAISAITPNATYAAGGGGGSGSTAWRIFSAATLTGALNASSRLDINIGAGGAGATAALTKGGNGGSSSIGTVTAPLFSAAGGVGGRSATNAFGAGGAGGGAPTTGTINLAGAVGGFGAQPKASATIMGGMGAPSFWGGGTQATVAALGNAAGPAGNTPGSGGAGGVSFTSAAGGNGGVGAAGMAIILGLHRA